MIPHFLKEDWNRFKNIALLQLYSKSELRDETKTFLEPKFFSVFSQI